MNRIDQETAGHWLLRGTHYCDNIATDENGEEYYILTKFSDGHCTARTPVDGCDFVLCENCCNFYPNEGCCRVEGRTFCCDDCAAEDDEERRIGEREAQREFDIWGNDYDSWYR